MSNSYSLNCSFGFSIKLALILAQDSDTGEKFLFNLAESQGSLQENSTFSISASRKSFGREEGCTQKL